MKTKYILSALLAAGLASVAHAQTAPAVDDLVVGFRSSSSSVANNYEVDLGAVVNYQGLAAGTVENLSSLANLNLSGDFTSSSLFGASAFTNSTVTWGAVATSGATGDAINAAETSMVSQSDGTITAPPSSWVASSPENSIYTEVTDPSLSTRGTKIQNVENGPQSSNGFTASSTPTNAGYLAGTISKTAPDSWQAWLTSSSNGFGNPLSDANTKLALASGSGTYSVLDIYSYGDSGGTTGIHGSYLGSLELGSDGTLLFSNFDPVAIPEPSVYAAILGAACLGFVAIRRRKQQMFA
jgi:hypothetical protein